MNQPFFLVPVIQTEGTGPASMLVDPVFSYSHLGADAILIEDISKEETAHEKVILQIKAACSVADCPVWVRGPIHRLEDVKKYLYTGASKVEVAEEKDRDGSSILETAAARFGKNKIGTFENAIFYHDVSSTFDFFAEKERLQQEGTSVYLPTSPVTWEELKKLSDGLVPVIVQDDKTREVLMLAYMNEEAFHHTLKTGRMTYYSRSRKELWIKGATSGHYQFVKSLKLDCDKDTLLATVHQIGAACHTGSYSCFFTDLYEKGNRSKTPAAILQEVYEVISDRKKNPKEGSYTNYLFDKGLDKILKKVGEEACEMIIAAKNPEREELIYEFSDFLYHAMVLMAEKEITWEEITRELANR